MGKLIEEKALEQKHHLNGFCNYSLEEKVSEFLNNNNNNNSAENPSDEDTDGFGLDGHQPNHPAQAQRTLYWESQKALLQEILERHASICPKFRQEICGIIEVARSDETSFCGCTNPSVNDCTHCLRNKVVSLLCQKGLNANLCVSKWTNTKNHPGGKHEYIEVSASTQVRKQQIQFVIELEFRDQFEIAKACNEYNKLVEQLPAYYVGKSEYLNSMVGIMCDAAKRSMEENKLHMGPWRKRSFMQMKWSKPSHHHSIVG